MELIFDRGTLLLKDLPEDAEGTEFPGVLWDARVGAHRAPARLAYSLAAAFRRRGIAVSNAPCPGLEPPSGFRAVELRQYQEASLSAWRRAGRRGVVVLPTGAGKTHVALAAMAGTRTSCLCLVPTCALLQQWTNALKNVYDGPIGRFGDGQRVLAPVTVATFASAYRHMSMLGDRFGLLVVDEAHHFGHGVFDEALEMSIAPLRLGLTATPTSPGPAATRLSTLLGPTVFELCLPDLAGGFLA
ncbi:MAG TPA: DEAD/DEAH box helicase family protein, partial [Polyangia bacterium]